MRKDLKEEIADLRLKQFELNKVREQLADIPGYLNSYVLGEAAALKRRQASAAADLHHVVRAQRKVVATKASLVARGARAQYLKPGADGFQGVFATLKASRAKETKP